MARYCDGCGKPLDDGKLFCDMCGRKAQNAPAAPAPRKEPRSGLFLGFGLGAVITFIVLVFVVGGGALAVLVYNGSHTPAPTASPTASAGSSSTTLLNPFPEELKAIGDNGAKVNCTFKSPDYIIPANYRSLNYVVSLHCNTDKGSAKLMVTVEIPEFTQKYEQMIDVSRAETVLAIHPPLLDNVSRTLNTFRDAQVVVTVKDVGSGLTVMQETRPVKLYSFYDMKWEDEDGTPYYENILAWVTPEDPQILKMLRDSGDSLNELTNGQLDAVVGYQPVGNWSPAQVVEAQVSAMMYTLAAKYNVQYTNASFSSTSSMLQRVATPASVITNHAGLCIETAVTMASAIQSTGMHAVVIILPGHAQVAVETWYGSGNYVLIETTALDFARDKKFNQNVYFELSKEQWKEYLAQDGFVAIDCDLAQQLNITPID
jgi:hypothetical protein